MSSLWLLGPGYDGRPQPAAPLQQAADVTIIRTHRWDSENNRCSGIERNGRRVRAIALGDYSRRPIRDAVMASRWAFYRPGCVRMMTAISRVFTSLKRDV
jgi:hypothetical protein